MLLEVYIMESYRSVLLTVNALWRMLCLFKSFLEGMLLIQPSANARLWFHICCDFSKMLRTFTVLESTFKELKTPRLYSKCMKYPSVPKLSKQLRDSSWEKKQRLPTRMRGESSLGGSELEILICLRTATAPCTQAAFGGQPHRSSQQPYFRTEGWIPRVLVKALTLLHQNFSKQ